MHEQNSDESPFLPRKKSTSNLKIISTVQASMVSFTPSILPPRVRISSTPSMLHHNLIDHFIHLPSKL